MAPTRGLSHNLDQVLTSQEVVMGMVRRRTRRRTMMVAGGMAYAAGRRSGEADTYGGEPAYDEAPPPPPAPPPAAPADVDATSEIEKLASLHDAGSLSDEEFAAAKQKILGV